MRLGIRVVIVFVVVVAESVQVDKVLQMLAGGIGDGVPVASGGRRYPGYGDVELPPLRASGRLGR